MRHSTTINSRSWVLGVLLFCALPLHAQTCQTGTIHATAPDSRYTDNGDGTVTDAVTGLIWKQCSEGQSTTSTACDTGTVATYHWQQALQQAQTVNASGFAGRNDWRLPNRNELTSLVERQCVSPSINATYFPLTASKYYWSSSTSGRYPNGAWGVEFIGGRVDSSDKSSPTFAVRLVRGGQ